MAKKSNTQSGTAVAVAGAPEAAVGRGAEATEQQARAIICTAKRAMEEVAKAKTGGDSAAAGKPSLSLTRSLECFLEGRKNKKATSSTAARRHLESFPASSSSSSSSN